MDNFCFMPENIILKIFSFLDIISLLKASQTCKLWHRIAFDNLLWKDFFYRNFKINRCHKIRTGADSYYDEFKKLSYDIPSVETEVLKHHKDEVLHISFSNNGQLFVTTSKDVTFKVWNCSPVSLKFSQSMKDNDWKYTQYSSFNENDSLLLISGVHNELAHIEGEIAIFKYENDKFVLMNTIPNKPFDIFGAWLNEKHVIAAQLDSSMFQNISRLWVYRLNTKNCDMIKRCLFKFQIPFFSLLHFLVVARCPNSTPSGSDIDDEKLGQQDILQTCYSTCTKLNHCNYRKDSNLSNKKNDNLSNNLKDSANSILDDSLFANNYPLKGTSQINSLTVNSLLNCNEYQSMNTPFENNNLSSNKFNTLVDNNLSCKLNYDKEKDFVDKIDSAFFIGTNNDSIDFNTLSSTDKNDQTSLEEDNYICISMPSELSNENQKQSPTFFNEYKKAIKRKTNPDVHFFDINKMTKNSNIFLQDIHSSRTLLQNSVLTKENYSDNGTKVKCVCSNEAAVFDNQYATDILCPTNKLPCTDESDIQIIVLSSSVTYSPHEIMFKKFCFQDYLTFLKSFDDGEEEDPVSTQADVVIDLKGHIIGICLSPDHKLLYVNIRLWPSNAVIGDPLDPPPISQEIEVRVIDLQRLELAGEVYRAHKAFTSTENPFFLYLNANDDYILSGSEDNKGYMWDRHYNICLSKFDHTNVVSSVAINPVDESMVVTASDDFTVKVWRSRRFLDQNRSEKL